MSKQAVLAQIETLKSEIDAKLEEIAQLAIDNEVSAYFELDGRGFSVFDATKYDEEDREYYEHEYGIEHGQWCSSSSFC